MSSALDRLDNLFRGAEGEKRLLDWLGDGVTQAMLMAARELYRPQRPGDINETAITLELGASVGANEVLDFLHNPLAASTLRSRRLKPVPVPDYGARKIREMQQATTVKGEPQHA